MKSGKFIDLLAKTISELKGIVSYSNISSKTDLLELKDKMATYMLDLMRMQNYG